jgi:hypothetical protein
MRRKPYPLWDDGFTYAFVDEHPLNQEILSTKSRSSEGEIVYRICGNCGIILICRFKS